MQAIETEDKGPTNIRGARIIARAQAGRVVVPWDYALSSEANHDAACRALAARYGWHGTWIRGARADGKGHVYVCMMRECHSWFCTPHPHAAHPNDYLVVRALDPETREDAEEKGEVTP